MPRAIIFNAENVKIMNRITILKKIFKNYPISRKELAIQTGFTPATVSNLVRELIKSGLIVEMGDDTLDKRLGGPNPILLGVTINPPYVIAVHIGHNTIRVGIVNLCMEILSYEMYDIKPEWNIYSIIDKVQVSIKKILEKNKLSSKDVISIGVSIGGVVDSKSGIVISYQFKSQKEPIYNLPLGVIIEKAIGIPTFIDNVVHSIGLMKANFFKDKTCDNFIIFYIGSIIGSAIVINGELLKGHRNVAGQIGLSIVRDTSPLIVDNNNYLEKVLSQQTLIEYATGIFYNHKDSVLNDLVTNPKEITKDIIVKAAELNDPYCKKILVYRGDLLGRKLAETVNFIDPYTLIVAYRKSVFGSVFEKDALEKSFYKNLIFKKSPPSISYFLVGEKETYLISSAAVAMKPILSSKLKFINNSNDDTLIPILRGKD